MKNALLVLFAILTASSPLMAKTWYVPYTQRRNRTQTSKPVVKVPVILTPAELAAKSVLDRMAGALNRAEGITFDGVITYPADAGGKIVDRQTTAVTTLERIAKLSIQSVDPNGAPNGTILADGQIFTLYDSLTNRYVRISVSPDVFSLEQALELGGSQIYPRESDSARDLRVAIGFPMIFFNRVYDVDEVDVGDNLTYTMTNSTSAGGTAVTSVTETLTTPKRGSMSGTYTIDSATNLPVQFTQIQSMIGKQPVTDIQETFKNLKVIRTPLVNTATYSFVPPTGATAYRPD